MALRKKITANRNKKKFPLLSNYCTKLFYMIAYVG